MWPTVGSILITTEGAKRNPAKNPAMITPVTATLKPSVAERTPIIAPFKPLPTINRPRPTKSGQVPAIPDVSERDITISLSLATAGSGLVAVRSEILLLERG
jgi:hypothetical protein